jgi:hypothetical protein
MEAIAEKVDEILFAQGANRNLYYNGAMQVAQRRTSVTGITTGTGTYHTADRWLTNMQSLGTFTQAVDTDVPTGQGFRNSLKMTCTSADAAPAAADFLMIQQRLEGLDCQAIRKGTANAQQLTVSFWVKSNKTGTYIFELYDNTNTRHCCKAYTVNSSGVWEYKTITFPADLTGALANTTDMALLTGFILGAGSNRTTGTLATTWAAYNAANEAVGQVNLADTLNNYWQVTGVQLNIGPIATPFEFKPFEQELRECQRYYEKSYLYGTAPGTSTFDALITMAYSSAAGTSGELGGHVMMTTYKRIPPNVTWYDQAGNVNKCTRLQAGVANHNNQSVVNGSIGEHYLGIASVSGTAGTCAIQVHFVADAEL